MIVSLGAAKIDFKRLITENCCAYNSDSRNDRQSIGAGACTLLPGRKKNKKGLKENRVEEDYSIVTNDRKGSGEGGEHEVAGVHGPPTHSGLENICSEVARD